MEKNNINAEKRMYVRELLWLLHLKLNAVHEYLTGLYLRDEYILRAAIVKACFALFHFSTDFLKGNAGKR